MDIGVIIILVLFGILLMAITIPLIMAWVHVHRKHKRMEERERETLERRLMKNLDHLRMDKALRIVELEAEQERIMTEGWLNAILKDAEDRSPEGGE